MNLLLQVIVLFLCFLMFIVRKEYKIALLLMSAICFTGVSVHLLPIGRSMTLLNLCFLLSELPHIKSHWKILRKSVLWGLIVMELIAFILLVLNSPHYTNDLSSCIRLFIVEIIAKYLVIGYAFISVKDITSIKPMIKISFGALIMLTVLGGVNLIMQHAGFVDIILQGSNLNSVTEDLGGKYANSEEGRFRVQSMFLSPFDYGYISMMLLILHFYAYKRNLESKLRFGIVIICSLFGIVFCGCRTIIICTIIGLFVYVCVAFDWKKKIRYFLFVILVGVISYNAIEPIHNIIDSSLSVFDKKSEVKGSSIEMRTLQYARVFYYVEDHLLFGRGRDFFLIDLGWKGGRETLRDDALQGLEGITMGLLLERGLMGIFFWIFFYTTLFYTAYSFRKQDRFTAAICITIITIYLCFANMTGELFSVFPTLLLLGTFLAILYKSPSLGK